MPAESKDGLTESAEYDSLLRGIARAPERAVAEVPKTIDRYAIEGVLGEGGMGRVYRALDPRLGRRVALKVLLLEGTSGDMRRIAAARMEREARATAALNHPNVVAVYDVGEFEGNPFIAMELVAGKMMRTALADPAATRAQKLAWLLDVARGLGAAHRVGLVHRDVKPENVMVTADGVAKILDFGIARGIETEAVDPAAPTAEASLVTLTARGVTIGTPQYMSPEQLQSEPVDGRTDQFSWAVVTWEAFAGELPWGRTSGAKLIAAILATQVPRLSEVVDGIDSRVSDAVARALEKRPNQRFATMDDLVLSITRGSLLPGSKARKNRDTEEPSPIRAAQAASRGVLPRRAKLRDEAVSRAGPTSSGRVPIAPLPCPPGASPFQIKGAPYRGFVRHVTRAMGLDAFVDGLHDERLSVFMRQPFLATARYDILPFFPLSAALAQMQGIHLEALVRTSSVAQARYDAKTAYKLIFDTSNLETIVDRFVRFNSKLYNFGSFSANALEKNHISVQFAGIPAYIEPWFVPMHVAYTVELLRLNGALDVTAMPRVPEEAGTRAGYPLRTYRMELRWR